MRTGRVALPVLSIAIALTGGACFRPTLARSCVGETVIDGKRKYSASTVEGTEVLALIPPERAAAVRRKIRGAAAARVAMYAVLGLEVTLALGLIWLATNDTSPIGLGGVLALSGTSIALGAINLMLIEQANKSTRDAHRMLDAALIDDLEACVPKPSTRRGDPP